MCVFLYTCIIYAYTHVYIYIYIHIYICPFAFSKISPYSDFFILVMIGHRIFRISTSYAQLSAVTSFPRPSSRSATHPPEYTRPETNSLKSVSALVYLLYTTHYIEGF